MFRLSHLIFLAVALACPSVPAWACRVCEQPSAAFHASNPAPDAPFQTLAPGALYLGELDYLFSLEDGRYVLKNGYMLDTRASSQENHLLSNRQVHALLRARAKAVVADLRAKHDLDRLDRSDRKTGLLLLWNRGPLLNDPERRFLEGLNRLELGKPPPPSLQKPKGPPSVPSGEIIGGKALTAGVEESRLFQRLEDLLDLVDHGDPKEAVGLRMALRWVLETSMGREVAQEFLDQNVRVKVSFEEMRDSRVAEVNGKIVLKATTGGYLSGSSGRYHLALNKDYLKTHPDFQRVDLPDTLGHELFGHGLEYIKAHKAGVEKTYSTYVNNESNAGLVGGIIYAELSGKLISRHMGSYVEDPEKSNRELHTKFPFYAGTFSLSEMADPTGALRERIGRIEAKRKGTRRSIRDWKKWRGHIDHFVTVHGRDRKSFRSILEGIEEGVELASADLKSLDEIESYVHSLIQYYTSTQGSAAVQRMRTDSTKPFFVEAERKVVAHRRRLKKLLEGKQQEELSPLPPGQVTWSELVEMSEKDRKEHPEYWRR